MNEDAKWQLIAVVAAVALAAFGVIRLIDGSRVGDSGDEPVRVSRAPEDSTTRSGESTLFVHVTGAVRRPGVYRLPHGTRIAAAVRRAGGATTRADLMAVNLAAPIQDGQQVVVPLQAHAVAGVAGGASRPGGRPISLATATAAELEELDGIGETIAERIVEYRSEHGGLRSVDQLAEVDGIGEKRLEALKDELGP